MLFVTLCKARPTASSRERTARRLEYHFPEGCRVLGEYWTGTDDPAVILVSEMDDIRPHMAAVSDWEDVFEIESFPVITAEEGIALAKERLAMAVRPLAEPVVR